MPWRRKWQPTPVFLPGESHGQRSLVGYHPQGCKELDMTDLIDRVPDELWNEVRDIVQETGIKTIPMEKKCKKAKWLSGEGLQIAVERT